jgi:1-aminocyclopropane-1-carboxylate deaminase
MSTVISIDNIPIQIIEFGFGTLHILRLDEMHPQVNGNKFFKLYYNIEHAIQKGYASIVSTGGAYSNHLHALAAYTNLLNLQSIGIVRGTPVKNTTLSDCKKWGMQLHFAGYTNWHHKPAIEIELYIKQLYPQAYYIPLGGENNLGAQGFNLLQPYFKNYNTIITSVGTGTTLAGVLNNIPSTTHVIGIQAVKDASVPAAIAALSTNSNYTLLNDYTFGGFAKHIPNLLQFIQQMHTEYNLPLDIVYNAKAMYALQNKEVQKLINFNKPVLYIHTGGLQGNRSIL